MKIKDKIEGWADHAYLRLVLRVMKLTTIFIFICLMQVSALTKAQITLKAKNESLQKVLETIKAQSGYGFLYSTSDLAGLKSKDINLQKASIEKALEEAFEGQPLQYEIQDKTVMIKKKSESLFDRVIARFQSIDVYGTVVDENGRPLPGVTVKVKDGSKGVITDANGAFSLKGVDESASIVISYIGYKVKELAAAQSLGNIQLEATDSKLDEVQVIAYGKTSQRYSTGNVSTVSAKDIEKSPVSNPLLAIQGRIAGLNINQATGYSGSGVSTAVQGTNSIGSGNDPLYVVDGVPYPSQALSLQGITGNSSTSSPAKGSTLSFLNPNDIESISVLKDADATAIYGSRAANGAILITTKTGKLGQNRIDLRMETGVSEMISRLGLMNTDQYLEMRREAIENDGGTIQESDYDVNGFWDNTRNTDWQEAFLGKTAKYTNIYGSISGGTNLVRYSLGGTLRRETTLLPGDFRDLKGGTNFSLSANNNNNKFQLQFTGNYLLDNNQLPNTDLTTFAMLTPPNAPALYNSDGSLNFMPNASGASTFDNPLRNLNSRHTANTHNLISNLVLTYNLLSGLNFRTSLGYNRLQTSDLIQAPLEVNLPENIPNSQRSGLFGNYTNSSWIIEPQLTCDRAIGNGKIEFLVGGSLQRSEKVGNLLAGDGFNTDEAIANIHSAATITSLDASAATYKYSGIFSRISYVLNDKYLLNLSARRDGSSRFGPANRFHNFAAIGAGWIFSEENFVKSFAPFLSFGKLKASYGTSGNDQLQDYSFLNLYSQVTVGRKYRGLVGITSNGLYNPFLQWELTKKANIGIDFGVFKDKILINANYYINRSSNQLLSYTLPSITGVNSITTNFPAVVQNSGWEFTMNGDVIKRENFSWKTSLNLTLPQNKLLRFDNLESSTYAQSLFIGKPLSTTKWFRYAGINHETGVYQFYDAKGNLTSTPDFGTDRTQYLNTAPIAFGGWTNTLSYKAFTLDVLFQFMQRYGRNDFAGFSYPGVKNANQPTYLLGRWNAANAQNAKYQRFNTDYSLAAQWVYAGILSDRAYSDATYCRLKNVSLSWRIPEHLTKMAGISTSSIYVQGQNLLTITGYEGLDPETLSATSLPPLRTLVIGLQLGF